MSLAKLQEHFSTDTARHYARVVAFAVLGMVLGAIFATEFLPARDAEAPMPVYEPPATTSNAFVLEKSEPLRINIPAVGIEADFEEPLGVNEDRSIEVPDAFDTVGWYQYGPAPGELGPAVVLGHVDSYIGPAVFWSLGELEPGDEIYIDRADGTTATFTVTHLERHEQSGFPTAKVYGDIDHAGLRLITCSGTYQRDVQRYTHNLIVFAQLQEPDTEESDL